LHFKILKWYNRWRRKNNFNDWLRVSRTPPQCI